MKTSDKALQVRKNFIQLLEQMTLQDVNCVVPGFQNTIAWNFGHIVVSQQKLCYLSAGVPISVSQEYLALFQKGTKTTRDISQEELEELKKLAYNLIYETDKDIENGYLDKYQPLQTHFGILLQNSRQAAEFSVLHDAMHLGYAQAQRRAIEGINK